jgi:hypothetical protein
MSCDFSPFERQHFKKNLDPKNLMLVVAYLSGFDANIVDEIGADWQEGIDIIDKLGKEHGNYPGMIEALGIAKTVWLAAAPWLRAAKVESDMPELPASYVAGVLKDQHVR